MKNRNLGGIVAALKKVQAHPIKMAAAVLAIYFLMDSYMLNTLKEIGERKTALCFSFAFALFYIGYVAQYHFRCPAPIGKDIPGWIKNPRNYVLNLFLILVIIVQAVSLSYDAIILNWFPNLEITYYRSQVFLLVFIAPVLEELTFRYFLYDRWARIKFGEIKGILLTSFIFVICHPVTNIESMILYWWPALAFYLVYESFGLYGSIAAHMVFNFLAL